jgi:hypothetical protein
VFTSALVEPFVVADELLFIVDLLAFTTWFCLHVTVRFSCDSYDTLASNMCGFDKWLQAIEAQSLFFDIVKAVVI